MDEIDSLSLSVVEAIANTEGTDPTDLDVTLNDHIDPDLLDRLGSDGPSRWMLEFVVGPYVVDVDHHGEIIVKDREEFGD